MSEKICKVKNVSSHEFTLTFERIEKGKVFVMKPNATVSIDADELNYLNNECSGAFSKGYLQIVDLQEGSTVDAPETKNAMTREEMEEILNSSFAKMKSQINKIEMSHVLKDLRLMAEEMNKSSKVIELIDARIEQVADSLVL